MITNETRAKLIGLERGYHGWERNGRLVSTSYDTDANAVAELRAFVRARGKEVEFSRELMVALGWPRGWGIELPDVFPLLDTTPAQQTAAFDAVFKSELERINET